MIIDEPRIQVVTAVVGYALFAKDDEVEVEVDAAQVAEARAVAIRVLEALDEYDQLLTDTLASMPRVVLAGQEDPG